MQPLPKRHPEVLLAEAIARAETGLSNVFTFVVIICSPFMVAGGSAYSWTMGNSSNEEESTQGFISTMSSPAWSSSKSKGKKTPISSTKCQSKILSSVAYSSFNDDDGLVASMGKTHTEDGDGAKPANKTDRSAKFPFHLHVDPKCIGHNHPFFIVCIKNQIVGKTNVWEIILMAKHPGEVDWYMAEVSGPSSITATMPLVPWWLLDESRLHGRSCPWSPDATGRKQVAWAFMQYDKNTVWIANYLKHSNQLVYFLIHFPMGTMLGNALFGRDCQLEK
jgi:hypothetical protein